MTLLTCADARELATLDLEDMLGGPGVTCVEWPAILEDTFEPPWARVRISPEGDPTGRRLDGELTGTGWESTRAALAALGAGPA